MSFFGNCDDARKAIHEVEESNDIGQSGKPTSPLLNGSATPGVSNAASGMTMDMKRTKARTKTSTLKRNG